MSEHRDEIEKTSSGEEMFPTVGEQAEGVDYVNAADLRTTGAEDSQGRPVQEIDSLCMNCHEQGTTKLLMTYIPNFREVVLMSFQCPHCGFRNSEIQSATTIQDEGHEWTLTIETPADLARQIVKAESATAVFPDLDVEIPPGPGRVTTIDGLLGGMSEDLGREQPVRKHVDPELYEKIEAVIAKLNRAVEGETLPLRFVLNDPAGNSFVAPETDPTTVKPAAASTESSAVPTERKYKRTAAQSRAIGLDPTQDGSEDRRNRSVARDINAVGAEDEASLNHGGEFSADVPLELREEVQTFIGACPSCGEDVPTNMKIVNIPHFKDVIIMSTVCSSCGYRSNEVKTGGAIPDQGRRVTLEIVEAEDLTRDILKSETCALSFPQLNLDLTAGTLGGRFTTIEGLLEQVHDQLEARVAQNANSVTPEEENRWAVFLSQLQAARDGEVLPLTVKMEDPLAASYIQNVYAPDADPNMVIEDYERTFEENEDLGLNDTNA